MSIKQYLKLFKRLWKHIIPKHRLFFGLVLGLTVLTSITEIISIGAILPFLAVLTTPDHLFSNSLANPVVSFLGLTDSQDLLISCSLLFILAVLVSGLMRVCLLLVQTRLSYAVGAEFSISIYRRTLYQPYINHIGHNSSELIAGVRGKANMIVTSFIVPTLGILSASFMLTAIMFAMLVIEPKIAIGSFLGFSLIYLAVILITKNGLKRDGNRANIESARVIRSLQEGLGGIRDVLIDGTQEIYCKIYSTADLSLRRAEANIQIIAGSPRFFIEALGMILIACLALFLAKRQAGISGAIPILGALALSAQRLMPVLQQAYSGWVNIQGGQSSVLDALELLDQPIPQNHNAITLPIKFDSSIALKRVHFQFPNNPDFAISGVNLHIPKFSKVGFIGTTGSGKSTLMDILMGLLQPTLGEVIIDEEVLTLDNYRAWQHHIAHVPQSIFLADTSIAENIAFGIPKDEIDYELVQDAAKKAQIASIIDGWKDGYRTKVGERGVRLSGGQRQRIGIARALYKKANVLILDEATSALDNRTEKSIIDTLENLSQSLTIMIVAHRLTTLKSCTKIVELEHGRIKRVCTYEEILEG